MNPVHVKNCLATEKVKVFSPSNELESPVITGVASGSGVMPNGAYTGSESAPIIAFTRNDVFTASFTQEAGDHALQFLPKVYEAGTQKPEGEECVIVENQQFHVNKFGSGELTFIADEGQQIVLGNSDQQERNRVTFSKRDVSIVLRPIKIEGGSIAWYVACSNDSRLGVDDAVTHDR